MRVSGQPLVFVLSQFGQSLYAAKLKITPLGSHDGEFCTLDRALVFEDPDGTRILYDAGRMVRGPEDPRLGKIDAVLLSHVHGDHLGDLIQPKANAGSCSSPDFSVKVTPESNSVNIVVGKKARFLLGGEMPAFFAKKVQSAGGDAKLVQLVRFGGITKVGGVSVASVPAVHSNGLSAAFLDTEKDLVKPKSVIASHANEEATKNGKLIAGTKTDAFKKAVKVPVFVPLSGITMEFDGKGDCKSGCQ
jgi:glyoxylase-like metal-dependent hydrolase (beta-lactamase superfamily II)